ncbi:hypothetical protein [Kaistia sp. MMO-174]|uniref:hypothetical protein n=1 Tax=Kaistia sp. MMO-174 TaxID=3081256 RepID=UPI00301778E2
MTSKIVRLERCAHCGISLELDAKGETAQHPGDDCVLSQLVVLAEAFPAWNRRASPAAPTVAIKPLEWTQRPPPAHDHEPFVYWAAGIGGHYKVEPDGTLWMAHDAFVWEQYGSQKEAKAAAQADHDRRASALVEPAPAVAVPEVARVALAALDNYADPTGYTDSNGEQYEAGEDVHPGLLAKTAAAEIRAILAAAPTPPAAEAEAEDAARSIAKMMIEWFAGPRPNNEDMITALILKRLSRFTPPAAEAPGQEPVAVKALEWYGPSGHGVDPYFWAVGARTETKSYRIDWTGYGRGHTDHKGPYTVDGLGSFRSINAAKAAAQADFERRISSALVSAPPTYADAEAKGFERGIEAAAKWHDEKARWNRGHLAGGGRANMHEHYASEIRSLASPAPKGET